jgi:hypothetical protein
MNTRPGSHAKTAELSSAPHLATTAGRFVGRILGRILSAKRYTVRIGRFGRFFFAITSRAPYFSAIPSSPSPRRRPGNGCLGTYVYNRDRKFRNCRQGRTF